MNSAIELPTLPSSVVHTSLNPKAEPIEHISGADVEACVDHVFVLRPNRADETPGGIHLPDSVKKPYHYGYAASVGPKVTTVAKGDWVMFAPESARDLFADRPNQTILSVVSEDGIYGRMSTKAVQELNLVLPQTDIMDVLQRTCETAVAL